MPDYIADGRIRISVDDDAALAELRRIDAEYEKTMRDIDRRSADMKLGADSDALKRELKKAEAEVKAYEKYVNDADTRSTRAARQRSLDRVKAVRDEAAAKVKASESAAEALKKENAERDLAEKRIIAAAKQQEKLSALQDKADKRRAAALAKEARLSEQVARTKLKEEAASERAARQRERELNEVPRLQAQYVRLTDQLEKLGRAKSKAGRNQEVIQRITLKEEVVKTDIERIRRTVHDRIGRDPITIPARVTFAERAGGGLRSWIDRNRRPWYGIAGAAGRDIGKFMGDGVGRGFKAVADRGIRGTIRDAARGVRRESASLGRSLMQGISGGLQALGHRAAGLADMSIRLGPFTSTIRQAMLGLSLFAPLIMDLVGALGSLVSVAGAAALGVGALGAAVVGGGVPALLGFGLVIKGVMTDFKNVAKAQKAYDDALRKGNTTLAKKKLEELRKTMGNVSVETAKTFTKWRSLSQEFRKATTPARAAVFTGLADGIKTAQTYMKSFTRSTNQGMQQIQQGFHGWMQGLRSAAGQNIIGTMMRNFNASIQPVMHGLGQLVAYLGRVGAIASRFLPGLARGFDNWAKKVNSVSTSALEGKVKRVIGAAKDVGRFFMAAGRFVKTFFAGGVDAGRGFVRTMTDALNRWTAFLNTAKGQQGLKQFFAESVKGAQTLFGFLAPLISGFVAWSRAIAPVARGFGTMLTVLSKVVGFIGRIAGMKGILTAIGVTLATLWGVGKIGTAIAAVGRFAAALLGLSRAGAAVKAAGIATSIERAGVAAATFGRAGAVSGAVTAERAAASGFVPIPGTVTTSYTRTAAAAEQTAVKMGRLGRAANVGKAGLAGLSSVVFGIPSVFGGAALAAVGLVAGLALLKSGTKNWEHSLQGAMTHTANYNRLSRSLGQGYVDLASATNQSTQAEMDLNATRKQSASEQSQLNKLADQGKRGTQEYNALELQHKQTLLQLRDAYLQRYAAQQNAVNMQKRESAAIRGTTREADKAVTDMRKTVSQMGRGGVADDFKKVQEGAKKAGMSVQDFIKKSDMSKLDKAVLLTYAAAWQKLQKVEQTAAQAHMRAALNMTNLERAMHGLPPLANSVARALLQVQRLGGKDLVSKISLKFQDPGQAQRVIRQVANDLRNGVPKSVVTKIIANSKNAEDALHRLRIARIPTKQFRILEQGGQKAVAMLERIIGRKLTPKEQKIVEHGGKNVLDRLAAITHTQVPTKTQQIQQQGYSSVMSAIQSIRSAFLPDKWVSINAHDNARSVIDSYRGAFTIGTRIVNIIAHRIGNFNKAQGGVVTAATGDPTSMDRGPFAAQRAGTGSLPSENLVSQAYRTAMMSGERTLRSGKVTSPALLVGEEATPEFVISTNPRDRARNRSYAEMAARAVGLVVQSAAGGGERIKRYHGGFDNQGGFHPDMVASPPAWLAHAGYGGSLERRTMIDYAWHHYITDTMARKANWEREVSIRESQVKEPENWYVKGKTKTVTDPVTGETSQVATYEPNKRAIWEYRGQIGQVMAAMRNVMTLAAALVRDLPKAQAANLSERRAREGHMNALNGQISALNSQHPKSQGAKDAKERRIEQLRGWISDDQQRISELRGWDEDYAGQRVDAGFSYREGRIAYQQNVEDYWGAMEKGRQAARDQTGSGTGGGGGGTGGGGGETGLFGVGGLSFVTASSEAKQALSDFGQNFLTPGTFDVSQVGASGVGGPGGPGASPMQSILTGSYSGSSPSLAGGRDAAGAMGRFSPTTTYGPGPTADLTSATAQKQITFNQNFYQQQDPHTFTKGVEFEVNTAF